MRYMWIKNYLKTRFSKYPFKLTLFVTDRCNARCNHCFYSNNLNKGFELANEQIAHLNNIKWRSVVITGGEPSLKEDVSEIPTFLDSDAFTYCTNGILTDKVVSDCVEMNTTAKRFKVGISLDGFRDTHNRMRGIDCFDKAIKTIKELKKHDIKVSISTTVSEENVGEIRKLNDYVLNDLKVDMQKFNVIRCKKEKTPVKAKEIIKEIMPKNGFFSDLITRKVIEMQFRPKPIRCLRNIAIVYPNGDLAYCEIKLPVCNLNDYNWDLKKAWEQIPESDFCQCTHEVLQRENILYQPSKWF